MGFQYETGMYGGSFNPLHLGHVDCILQAASLCRRLYIVLSVGVNRGEVPYRVRYRWLYQLTCHLGNVAILTLEDSAAAKADYTRDLWEKDAAAVKAQIGAPIDVVFCGDDYGEDSFWNLCYPDSALYIFPRNGMSSTEIRKNPYRRWDWLPEPVRPWYVRKVLLMGGESTGKSTLTISLARRFNTNYVAEAGRELSEKSGTDRMMLSQDFTEILLQHKLNEMRALEHSSKVLFIDTDALVTQFYMNFLEDPEIEKNAALSDALDALNTYDLILFLEPDVAFVQDGDRSPVIRDHREKYSRQIKDLLERRRRSFVCISGGYEERYCRAVELVQELLDGAPL
ncbi:MAG: AAA family ATPase [Lawsonibacter sp.]|nr:AAA family ATPase [Lawsonibacter sp.]